jgi:hypothetical protein
LKYRNAKQITELDGKKQGWLTETLPARQFSSNVIRSTEKAKLRGDHGAKGFRYHVKPLEQAGS